MKTLIVLFFSLTISAPAVVAVTSSAPTDVEVVEVSTLPFAEIPHYRSSPIVPTTTTTTTVPVFQPAHDAKCPEWHILALEAGWQIHDLDRLDFILWRESRCLTDAHNSYDPMSGSRGIAQINGFWCKPSRYNPSGWLQAQGLLQDCDDLYDPLTNLLAARAIWEYSLDRNGCGWLPWTTRNTKWCS